MYLFASRSCCAHSCVYACLFVVGKRIFAEIRTSFEMGLDLMPMFTGRQ
jgi:hypothetical protein